MTRCVFALSLSLTLAPALSPAGDWPQFRGPGGGGVSAEARLPAGFSAAAGPRWKVDLPGRGLASPVVVGHRVYVTASSGTRDDRLHVMAFDAATGAKLWHRQLAATGSTNCHPTTCMAAPTPVADAGGVYALFATGDLIAFDPDGNLRWYRSLVGEFPTITNQTGMASSPVLGAGKLVVPMENAGESFLMAVDASTGATAWKAERPRESNWTTPVVRFAGGKAEVLFQGKKDLIAYDLDTGAKKWAAPLGGSIPTASVNADTLVVPANGVTVARLRADGPAETWKAVRLQTGMSSPLLYDGRVYAANPKVGLVTCLDAATGKVLWEERVKGPFSGSPVAGDGKVYVVNETGDAVRAEGRRRGRGAGQERDERQGVIDPGARRRGGVRAGGEIAAVYRRKMSRLAAVLRTAAKRPA